MGTRLGKVTLARLADEPSREVWIPAVSVAVAAFR